MLPVRVDVCVITFQRPRLLDELLAALARQRVGPGWRFRIVVVDNDADGSAAAAVDAQRARTPEVEIVYGVEPEKSISLARNRAVAMSSADLVALIDDDTKPVADDWLQRLVDALEAFDADVANGPIRFVLPQGVPRFIAESGVWPNWNQPTGSATNPGNRSTNNVLLRRRLLAGLDVVFDPTLGRIGGEDIDLFYRLARAGARYVWCADAAVTEAVHGDRARPAVVLRRKFHFGQFVALNIVRHEPARFWRELAHGHLLVAAGILLTIATWLGAGLRPSPRAFHMLAKTTHHVGRLSYYYSRRAGEEYA